MSEKEIESEKERERERESERDSECRERVQSGWNNWKRVSGVLCDRKINVKIKGKVYRTLVYGVRHGH